MMVMATKMLVMIAATAAMMYDDDRADVVFWYITEIDGSDGEGCCIVQ